MYVGSISINRLLSTFFYWLGTKPTIIISLKVKTDLGVSCVRKGFGQHWCTILYPPALLGGGWCVRFPNSSLFAMNGKNISSSFSLF